MALGLALAFFAILPGRSWRSRDRTAWRPPTTSASRWTTWTCGAGIRRARCGEIGDSHSPGERSRLTQFIWFHLIEHGFVEFRWCRDRIGSVNWLNQPRSLYKLCAVFMCGTAPSLTLLSISLFSSYQTTSAGTPKPNQYLAPTYNPKSAVSVLQELYFLEHLVIVWRSNRFKHCGWVRSLVEARSLS